nr:unnamed protein product [Spirometra erinaceieuropaei]
MGDTNAAALKLGSGEGAIVTTVATPTCPASEKTDVRSNISGLDERASFTATHPAGENVGCRGAVKKIASRGRELRSTGDTNAAALQLGSGEGAIVTTVATPTCPAGERTDGRSNRNGPEEGASVTATHPAGENTGRHEVVKKIASLGRELRSMRTRAMTASARTPAPDERCLDNHVLPKSLSYRPPVNTSLAKRWVTQHGRRMIRALLQDCHLRLRKYNGVIRQEVAKCTDVIGEDGVTLLQQVIDERARELRAHRDAELATKLRSISHSSPGEDEILVHNMSSKQLTPTQLKVLRHEASFNTADADPVNLVATVESILKQTGEPDETTHLIRQQVTSLVMAHKPRAIITKAEQSALKALRNDTSIVILPTDKGRSTVVLDKTDYTQKANALLEDRQAYLPCGEESIKTLVTQLEKTLTDMQSNKAISKSVRLTSKPTDAAPARFYGLPKVHKPGLPLRPIVSLRGTPTYNLAKWLFRKLRSLTSNAATTVCSAAQFLERLKGIRLSEDEVMVSFDVTALFTLIPQCLAVQTVSELLECKYDETEESVKRTHLIQLLKFCLKTFFTFDGRVYEQTKGTPMGSPLSGFIAEAVLQKVETEVFETYRPKFWARYVDDTFVIIKREMVQTFHNVLNSVSPDIQFTMEAESNNELPFLDVLVHRNPNGHLKTTVYRKAANTRQILSYHSKHPLSHKRSCVRTLYKRADTHCSEPDDKRSELRHLQRLFMANGYPRNFIERNRQPVPSRSPVTERPKVWRALPYIDGVSEAVSRLLRALGIGIAHRPESTIRHVVMRPKTPLPPGKTTNVIYRIQCSSCEMNYIGETGAVLTAAGPSTSPADEKTDSRCGVNKIARLGRQLRSMKVRTATTNVSTPASDVD